MSVRRRQRPAILLWSGGKDATMALQAARGEELKVEGLLTTVLEEKETVTMHGVPLALVRRQADALKLPLHVMCLPEGALNTVYETRLADALTPARERGTRTVIAGDLFLEDIRAYREERFAALGMEGRFPLWHRDTRALAETFLADGYRAVVASVARTKLDPSFAGRPFDKRFLADLPEEVDPCGEHGAFHTFVRAGPLFNAPISVQVGATCCTEGMCFARLRPGKAGRDAGAA